MDRRLYLTFPTASQARRAVANLERLGIPTSRMHAIAKAGTAIDGLPRASEGQKHDQVWRLERLFWHGNLGIFALAAVGLAVAWFTSSPTGMVVAAAIMLTTFLAGNRFAVRLPHAHLADLRVPLEHGEVVLLVDIPLRQVQEVEHLLGERHPEFGVGGVGWTSKILGV